MARLSLATLRSSLSIAAAAGVTLLGVMGWSATSRADVVYVQPGPPPPPPPDYYAPPPPPPRYYYRRRYAYYYDEREPLYALDLGVDLEGAVPLDLPRFVDGNNVQGGGGIKVRLGEQIDCSRASASRPRSGSRTTTSSRATTPATTTRGT